MHPVCKINITSVSMTISAQAQTSLHQTDINKFSFFWFPSREWSARTKGTELLLLFPNLSKEIGILAKGIFSKRFVLECKDLRV
jgi:hypothetical protein